MAYISRIEVILVRPNELPELISIPNTLESKQKQVEGCIEVTYLLDDDKVCLICNEEGKMNGSLPNRDIGHDIIYGNFLIAGDDYKNGDFISLTKEQIDKYRKRFNVDSIIKTNDRITDIKFVNQLQRELG